MESSFFFCVAGLRHVRVQRAARVRARQLRVALGRAALGQEEGAEAVGDRPVRFRADGGGHATSASPTGQQRRGILRYGEAFSLILNHRDWSIHIERACHCMHAIMTQHGLLHKGFHIS